MVPGVHQGMWPGDRDTYSSQYASCKCILRKFSELWTNHNAHTHCYCLCWCGRLGANIFFFSLLFKQTFVEPLNVKPNMHQYIYFQSHGLTVSTWAHIHWALMLMLIQTRWVWHFCLHFRCSNKHFWSLLSKWKSKKSSVHCFLKMWPNS